MTSLFYVAAKCSRGTPKVLSFVNVMSLMIKRGITHSDRYNSLIAFSTDKILLNNSKTSKYSRNFGLSTTVRQTIKANVDSNNVLSSSFSDIDGYKNIYLHEFMYTNLHKWHDKTALVCFSTGKEYTYAQLRKLSGRLATSIRKNKIRPSETIAIILPNVPEYPMLLLGGSEAGIRLTLINPAYTVDEMREQIKNSNAVAVFTTPSRHSTVAESISDNPNIRLPIVIIEDGFGTAPAGTIKFQDLVSDNVEEFEKTGEKTGVDPEDTLVLPFSSGTSGLPKGVELSHRNLISNSIQLCAEGITISKPTTATHQEIVPGILPFFHSYGLAVGLGLYLYIGGKIVTMSQFTPDNLFKILEEHRATLLYVAPPLVQLMAHDKRLEHRHMESVRSIVSGAAPIGKEMISIFKSRIPKSVDILQGYGLTETSPVICMGHKTPFESCGYVLPNTQIRIVGSDTENQGKNLGPDEVGEIYVRGPQVMIGYFKNPQATADCMEGDWFKTGDLGCYDKHGLMYIRGRLKELIKVQGYQVAPAELEHLIQSHEKVADAAVIGVPHDKYGEVPKAFVVPKKGANIKASEIKDFVAEKVSKYKQLGHVHVMKYDEKIPKSAAGKILRRVLQTM